MQRRKFSREFKLEAVNLVRIWGMTVAQAARDFISPVAAFAPMPMATFMRRSGKTDEHRVLECRGVCGPTEFLVEASR